MLAKVLSIKPGVGLCVIQGSIKPGVGQNRFLCAILEYVRTCFCVLSKGQSWSRSEQASVCYPQFCVSIMPGVCQNTFL